MGREMKKKKTRRRKARLRRRREEEQQEELMWLAWLQNPPGGCHGDGEDPV